MYTRVHSPIKIFCSRCSSLLSIDNKCLASYSSSDFSTSQGINEKKVSNEGVRAVRSRPEDFLEDITRPTKNYPLFASLVEQQKLQAITLHSFGRRIGTLTTQIMRLHQMCLVVRFGSSSIFVNYFNEKDINFRFLNLSQTFQFEKVWPSLWDSWCWVKGCRRLCSCFTSN